MTMPEVGSKRASSYDEYAETESPKRSRSGKVELRLLLVGRYCGAVVGKGAETIKSLRDKHRVQIRGLNNHAVNRVLSVIGERENCVAALSDILPLASSEAPYAATNLRDKCNFEINFLVHSGHVGAVIGKGGSKIKEITDASSGMIKIYQDCLPNSDERVVAIGGDTVDRIIVAIDIILDTIGNLAPKSQTVFYDPTKDESTQQVGNRGEGDFQDRRSHKMQTDNHKNNDNQLRGQLNTSLGALGGLNIAGASGLLGQLNAAQVPMGTVGQGGVYAVNQSPIGTVLANQLGNPLMNQLGNQLQSQLTPQMQNQLHAHLQNQLQNQLGNQLQNQLGNQLPNQLGRNMQGQMGNQMGGNMPAVNQTNNHDRRDNYKDERHHDGDMLDFGKMQTVTKVTITPEVCGAIIGKSGRNIKEIRHSSGAHIDFTGNVKGSKEDRVITITGTQRQIQIAEQMMTQFVRERNN